MIPINKRRLSLLQRFSYDHAVKILKKPTDKRLDMDTSSIKQLFQDFEFFQTIKKDIHPKNYDKILLNLTYQKSQKFQTLFEINQLGYHFYIILKGSVFILTPKTGIQGEQDISHFMNFADYTLNSDLVQKYQDYKVVNIFRQGQTFGEASIIHGVRRTATVICAEDTEFAVLDQPTYNRYVMPIQERQFAQDFAFFKNIYFLKTWKNFQLSILSKNKKKKEFQLNQVIYTFGDPVDNIYFIQEGDFYIKKRIYLNKKKQINQDCENQQKEENCITQEKEIDVECFHSDNIKDLVDEQLNQEIIQLNRKWKNNKQKLEQKTSNVAILGPGCTFGFEEILNGQEFRQNQVICNSQKAKVFLIKKKFYLDLNNNKNFIKQLENDDLHRWRDTQQPIPNLEDVNPQEKQIVLSRHLFKADQYQQNIADSEEQASQIIDIFNEKYKQNQKDEQLTKTANKIITKKYDQQIQQLPKEKQLLSTSYQENKAVHRSYLEGILKKHINQEQQKRAEKIQKKIQHQSQLLEEEQKKQLKVKQIQEKKLQKQKTQNQININSQISIQNQEEQKINQDRKLSKLSIITPSSQNSSFSQNNDKEYEQSQSMMSSKYIKIKDQHILKQNLPQCSKNQEQQEDNKNRNLSSSQKKANQLIQSIKSQGQIQYQIQQEKESNASHRSNMASQTDFQNKKLLYSDHSIKNKQNIDINQGKISQNSIQQIKNQDDISQQQNNNFYCINETQQNSKFHCVPQQYQNRQNNNSQNQKQSLDISSNSARNYKQSDILDYQDTNLPKLSQFATSQNNLNYKNGDSSQRTKERLKSLLYSSLRSEEELDTVADIIQTQPGINLTQSQLMDLDPQKQLLKRKSMRTYLTSLKHVEKVTRRQSHYINTDNINKLNEDSNNNKKLFKGRLSVIKIDQDENQNEQNKQKTLENLQEKQKDPNQITQDKLDNLIQFNQKKQSPQKDHNLYENDQSIDILDSSQSDKTIDSEIQVDNYLLNNQVFIDKKQYKTFLLNQYDVKKKLLKASKLQNKSDSIIHQLQLHDSDSLHILNIIPTEGKRKIKQDILTMTRNQYIQNLTKKHQQKKQNIIDMLNKKDTVYLKTSATKEQRIMQKIQDKKNNILDHEIINSHISSSQGLQQETFQSNNQNNYSLFQSQTNISSNNLNNNTYLSTIPNDDKSTYYHQFSQLNKTQQQQKKEPKNFLKQIFKSQKTLECSFQDKKKVSLPVSSLVSPKNYLNQTQKTSFYSLYDIGSSNNVNNDNTEIYNNQQSQSSLPKINNNQEIDNIQSDGNEDSQQYKIKVGKFYEKSKGQKLWEYNQRKLRQSISQNFPDVVIPQEQSIETNNNTGTVENTPMQKMKDFTPVNFNAAFQQQQNLSPSWNYQTNYNKNIVKTPSSNKNKPKDVEIKVSQEEFDNLKMDFNILSVKKKQPKVQNNNKSMDLLKKMITDSGLINNQNQQLNKKYTSTLEILKTNNSNSDIDNSDQEQQENKEKNLDNIKNYMKKIYSHSNMRKSISINFMNKYANGEFQEEN